MKLEPRDPFYFDAKSAIFHLRDAASFVRDAMRNPASAYAQCLEDSADRLEAHLVIEAPTCDCGDLQDPPDREPDGSEGAIMESIHVLTVLDERASQEYDGHE